jgi:hypothetical protein
LKAFWVLACLVQYSNNLERLSGVIQHELTHLFGVVDECHEDWCVMNYDYMPYKAYFWFIVVREDWATDWGPECKQTLLETYNGRVITRSKFVVFKMGMYACGISWTEEYIHWNLTRLTLNGFFGITFIDYRPPSRPFGDGAGHPTVTLNWNFKR